MVDEGIGVGFLGMGSGRDSATVAAAGGGISRRSGVGGGGNDVSLSIKSSRTVSFSLTDMGGDSGDIPGFSDNLSSAEVSGVDVVPG